MILVYRRIDPEHTSLRTGISELGSIVNTPKETRVNATKPHPAMYLPGIVAALGAMASMTCASPCTNPNPLPLVTLPYGTWRAARHDAKADVR